MLSLEPRTLSSKFGGLFLFLPALAEMSFDRVQLTLMGSSLYRHLGQRIGHGYEMAKSRQLFMDFIDAHATITLDERTLVVRFQRRAHNPLLVAAGFGRTDVRIPWIGNRRLQFQFG